MFNKNSAIVASAIILICSPCAAGAASLPLVDDARFEETTKANLANLDVACKNLLKALPELDSPCALAGHANAQIRGMKGICEDAPKLLRQTADDAKKVSSEAGALIEAKEKAEAELKKVDSQIDYFPRSPVIGLLMNQCPDVGRKLSAARDLIDTNGSSPTSVGRAFRQQVSALRGYYSHRQNP